MDESVRTTGPPDQSKHLSPISSFKILNFYLPAVMGRCCGLEAGEGSLKGQQGAVGALSLELAPGGAAPTTDTGHQHSQGLRCAGHRARCPEAKRMRFRSSRGGGLAGEKDCVRRNVKSSPGALWEVQSGPQGISGSVVVGGEGCPEVKTERGFQQRLPSVLPALPDSTFSLPYGPPPPGSPPCLPSRSGWLPFTSRSISCMSHCWCVWAV